MKHPDSTQMDRLLRRYARRDGEALRAVGDSRDVKSDAAGVHMDADEMSAYAEGAVSEAARSRYIAHLADCDSCRKIITSITLATGAVAEERTREVVEDKAKSKSWREWLAALFSPPVLRYGVPALALLAVIVVAFVATRTQREAQFTARNGTTTNQAINPASTANSNLPALTGTDAVAENHSNSGVITPEANPAATPSTSAATPPAPVTAVPGQQDAPAATTTTATIQTDQAPGAPAREQAEVLARKDDAASMPAPAPPPPAEAAPARKAGDLKDNQAEKRKAEAERDEEKVANQPSPNAAAGARPSQGEIAQDGTTLGKSEGTTATRSRARRPVFGAGRATMSEAPRQERAAETRQVSGRQFRREGNAWVDTTYKSSRSLTSVARGSEQYRALVADEPSLRTFAEQLPGEVIVVWKNRAYRFY